MSLKNKCSLRARNLHFIYHNIIITHIRLYFRPLQWLYRLRCKNFYNSYTIQIYIIIYTIDHALPEKSFLSAAVVASLASWITKRARRNRSPRCSRAASEFGIPYSAKYNSNLDVRAGCNFTGSPVIRSVIAIIAMWRHGGMRRSVYYTQHTRMCVPRLQSHRVACPGLSAIPTRDCSVLRRSIAYPESVAGFTRNRPRASRSKGVGSRDGSAFRREPVELGGDEEAVRSRAQTRGYTIHQPVQEAPWQAGGRSQVGRRGNTIGREYLSWLLRTRDARPPGGLAQSFVPSNIIIPRCVKSLARPLTSRLWCVSLVAITRFPAVRKYLGQRCYRKAEKRLRARFRFLLFSYFQSRCVMLPVSLA